MSEVFAAYLILSTVVQKVVERVRVRFPALDGDLVTVAAASLGVTLAVALDVTVALDVVGFPLPLWADYLLSGLAIGLGAGFLSDLTRGKASEPIHVERASSEDRARRASD